MKKETKRAVMALSLSAALALVPLSTTAAAAELQADLPIAQEVTADTVVCMMDPRFTHISRISSSLSFGALGRANCTGSYTLYEEYENDSKLTMTLQQFRSNAWYDIKTWTQEYTGSSVKMLEKGYYVDKGYRYRVVTSMEIFDSKGNVIEMASCDSPIQEY